MVDLPAGRLRWFLVFWPFVLGAVSYRYGWTSSFLAAAISSGIGGIAWLVVEPDHLLGPEGKPAH